MLLTRSDLMNETNTSRRYMLSLVLAALGVVYGDIGTSPLYALRECFHGTHPIEATPINILGVLSLIFWSLILIVSVKYLGFVMRANNHGEGGILALMSLAFPDKNAKGFRAVMLGFGVFGAALLYGDGMITPAISVLSAVEGLNVATPIFERYIIPITVVVLIMLFSFQHHGTGKVGRAFGPITLIWFFSISALGVRGILMAPEVFTAINPIHAFGFFAENHWPGFVVLGAVFLVVTGGEALYADMGHFGVRPIRLAWFGLVLPALLINYFGQGGLMLRYPETASNPFYNLAPKWSLFPLVGLATAATVIASQALISGAFSLTMQAIQLGYFPRLEIKHTSHGEKGQIYMPHVNWALMLACIGLVLGFESSSHLAAAYGIAVTMTMLITTALFYFAARRLWNWSKLKAGTLCGTFFLIEVAFFGANVLKIAHGGWFPLVIGAIIYTLMATWNTGRRLLREKLQASLLPHDVFMSSISRNPPTRVRGTAVYLAGNREGTPPALLHNLKHNKVLHDRVIMLTVQTDEVPYVAAADRVAVEKLQEGIYRVTGHYGFMEEPNIPRLLERCAPHGLEFKQMETTFFLSRETIIATKQPGMALWREILFAFMTRNAQRAMAFFGLPANRVVELGMQVEF